MDVQQQSFTEKPIVTPSEYGYWRFAYVELNDKSGIAVVRGKHVELDRTSLLLLKALLRRSGDIVSKACLLEQVWPERCVSDNALAKAISRLRKLLKDNGDLIRAVHGYGYQLHARVDYQAGIKQDKSIYVGSRHKKLWGAFLGLCFGCLLSGVSYLLYQLSVYKNENQALLSLLEDSLFSQVDPYRNASSEFNENTLIQSTLTALESRFDAAPHSAARLYQALASVYSGRGEYARAVDYLKVAQDLLDQSVVTQPVEFKTLLVALCQNLRLAGDVDAALSICAQAVNLAQALSHSDRHAEVNLGKVLFEDGQYRQAADLLHLVVSQTDSEAETQPGQVRANALWFLALCQRKLADFKGARASFLALIALQRELVGEAHPLTGWALADYGDFLVDIGEYDQAMEMLTKAQDIFDSSLGPEHPESLSPGYSLAVLHAWRGEWTKAKALLVPRLAGWRATIGSSHLWTLYTLSELALAEAELGNQQDAQRLLKEARNTGAQLLKERNAKSMHFHLRWSRTEMALGNWEAAQSELTQLRPKLQSLLPQTHPWVSRALCMEARIARMQNRLKDAFSYANSCTQSLIAHTPSTYPAIQEAHALSGQL